MARTRKSVLGENPFATGDDAARPSSVEGAKPHAKRKPKSQAESKPKAGKAGPGTTAKAAKKPSKAGPAKPGKQAKPAAANKKPTKPVAANKKPKPAKAVAAKPAKAVAAKPAKAVAAKPAKAVAAKPTKQTATAPAVEETEAPRTVTIEGKPNEVSMDGPAETIARQAAKRRIAAEIRELESTPDESFDAGQEARGAPGASKPLGLEPPGGEDGGMFDAARELLSSDYYLRQWGRLGMRNRSAEVDDFGHDLKYDARFAPLLDLLYERYFRVDTEGIEHVPAEGRALIVANHAGTFPYDGIMLKTALRREHPQARSLRWLAEDHLFYMPFVGSFLNRMGAVRACQENAERLLQQERLVGVFPEGAKGTGRLYRNRHKLQRFGRGGFVRLCLRTRTPVIPCVIVGAEESMPLLFRIEYLANLLGIPYIPITPTFPALGPLGVVPAPTKWQFTFGEPIHFERYGEEAAEDHVLVRRLTERVRATMQGMLDQTSASRRSLWFG